MRKIYLFCDAGMSTSLLVKKMQDVAEKHNLSVKIEAFPFVKAHAIITEERPDCILLGPQVRFLLNEMREKYKDLGMPIEVINPVDYGVMNGENVLKFAIKLVKENEKNK